jgi:hypothetical protein
MGLLDIWSDWKRNNQGTVQDDFSGMNSDAMSPNLNTAGGIDNPSYRRKESPLIKNTIFPEKYVPPGQGKIVINPDRTNKVLPNEIQMFKPENQPQGTPVGKATDPITQGGTGVKFAEDQGFLSKLSNMAGVDIDKAAANWKDKGGFEGLMSNPAFSLGLALMQSSANGKTINQGILDNFVKSAKISAEFKDRIEARKQEPIQATAGDVQEVKDLLKTMNVDDPSLYEKIVGKFKGENVQAMFDMASEDIANALQIEMKRMSDNNPNPKKPLVFDTRLKLKILKRLEREGKIKKKGGTFFTKSTLETDEKIKTRAQGGPVTQGEPYLVGEKGPEIIIPSSDGNVLTNDDSQIFNMLLASNPQLQKVSKQRAERILKARFPEYFEG